MFFQLLKKDETILNCQRSQIFIEDALKKKKAKSLKRLKQRQKFDLAKKELQRLVKSDENQAECEAHDDQNDDDDLGHIKENEMIYFDE